jgi:hypothetical protein
MITEDNCSHCRADLRKGQYTRRIAIYDRDLDCTAAFRCPDCGAQEARGLAETLSVADPTGFKK